MSTSVAISTLHSGAADELWLHDMRTAVAEGEAMDLSHGAAFYPACTVRLASLDEMRQTHVLVVAAGRGGCFFGEDPQRRGVECGAGGKLNRR